MASQNRPRSLGMACRGGDKAHVEVRRLARTCMLKGPIPECLKQTFPKGGMLAGLAADAHLCACSLAEWVWEKKKKKEREIKNRLLGRKVFQARDNCLCSLWLPSRPFPSPDASLAERRYSSWDCWSQGPGWQGTEAYPSPGYVPSSAQA